MRELVYFVATSIDGYIAGSDGDYTALLTEGDSLAALIERYPETLPDQARSALGIEARNRTFDTVVMGARTYQVPGGLPSPYPHLRQFVVSDTVREAPSDVSVLSGDVVEHIRGLKQEQGLAIWLCGGGSLAAQLLEEVDRLFLKVSPVVLGRGLPLFDGDVSPTSFGAPRCEKFDNGVVFQQYTRSR